MSAAGISTTTKTEARRLLSWRAAKPAAVLISGDITDNSYPDEFAEARALLEANFADIPVFVCSGNHDYSPYKPAPRRILPKCMNSSSGSVRTTKSLV